LSVVEIFWRAGPLTDSPSVDWMKTLKDSHPHLRLGSSCKRLNVNIYEKKQTRLLLAKVTTLGAKVVNELPIIFFNFNYSSE